MTPALPAVRLALRSLALVAALLAGVLCLLGAVTLDVARAAGAAAVREGADRSAGTGPQASAGRGAAESGQHAVRTLLRAGLPGAGASIGGDPEAAARASATALPAPGDGAPAPVPAAEDHGPPSVDGPSGRAPPRTAGT